jgi:hypothetical protein
MQLLLVRQDVVGPNPLLRGGRLQLLLWHVVDPDKSLLCWELLQLLLLLRQTSRCCGPNPSRPVIQLMRQALLLWRRNIVRLMRPLVLLLLLGRRIIVRLLLILLRVVAQPKLMVQRYHHRRQRRCGVVGPGNQLLLLLRWLRIVVRLLLMLHHREQVAELWKCVKHVLSAATRPPSIKQPLTNCAKVGGSTIHL